MKKCVYLAVLLASVLLTIHLFREMRRLQGRVQQLEEERVRAANAEFRAGWVGVSDGEKEKMIGIYCDIAQAYTNLDIMAMRIAMLKLPPVNDHLTWQIRPPIESPLTVVFDKAFRLAPKLSDFDSPVRFQRFVKANTEVALFLGCVYARRKSFDFASSYETLTVLRLKQYEEKFAKEGKAEFRDIASKELEFWTAWIESPKGFTHRFADDVFHSSTEYAAIVKPECALPRDKALETARKTAEAMLKPTGLSPSWLSEFQVQGTNSVTSGTNGQ